MIPVRHGDKTADLQHMKQLDTEDAKRSMVERLENGSGGGNLYYRRVISRRFVFWSDFVEFR